MPETTSPNARLESFLADHQVTADGECSCGWDIANYDIRQYDWEESDESARDRAWVDHVRRAWQDINGFGDKIQGVEVPGPSGDPIAFVMEPGHDSLREHQAWPGRTGLDAARSYHGEYRFADYEPSPPGPGTLPSRRLTCAEAGCRDPHCHAAHLSYSLTLPAERCAGCRKDFAPDEDRVAVVLQAPAGVEMTDGTPLASTAAYHTDCQPTHEEMAAHAAELWPPTEPEPQEGSPMRQAMACLACGLAGETPAEHYPQEPGLWDRPCPRCGAMQVWVTEPTD